MTFLSSIGFDLETSGDKQEYALQPFRAMYGKGAIKAASVALSGKTAGVLYPDKGYIRNVLKLAVSKDLYVVGWNVAFDVAWCIAIGLEHEVFAAKWQIGRAHV